MKKHTRVLSLVLCFAFLLPVMAVLGQLQVDAADGSKRFVFSSLVAKDETVYQADNENCPVLQLYEGNTEFAATELALMGTNGTTNALYIAFDLSDNANVNGVRIHYTYKLNNSSVAASEQRTWTQAGKNHSFVLHTPNVSRDLTALSVEFMCDGAPTGSVTMRSLFDVSVYTGDGDIAESAAAATVKKCVYNKETNTVDITVKLSHEASVYYAGQSLELFALAPKEDPYLSNKTYVARAGVSLNDIHFSVSVNGAEALFARYVIAAVNKEGMREPLCDPIYPDITAESSQKSHGFKGFHTDSLFSVIDSGADVEVVDVYLDKLESEQGILYAGSRSYYHFDQAYVGELDRRVQNLTGAGCGVYLRFLISPEANDYSFVEGAAGNIVHKGIVIDNEQALLDIHAYTDFLTSRYTNTASGRIAGIIIGRQADRASTYGYVGAKGLAEYAELYATALNLIAGTGRLHISDLQVVVPVSDRMWPEKVSPENLNGDYFSELFIVSLLEALKSQTMTPPEFSVMLESSSIPDILASRSRSTADTYGTDGIAQFIALIGEYSGYYGFLDGNVLYSWMPDPSLDTETLSAAYALQYIALTMNGRVRSFFTDLSLMSIDEQGKCTKALAHLITHIDTDQSESVTAPVLKTLKVDSFQRIFPEFTADAIKKAKVLRLSLKEDGYVGNKTPVGSYDLWNFSGATGILDWYAGNSCNDLSVLNRALTARLSVASSEEYADIAYHFSEAKNLSKATLLRFSIGLEGAANVPYEIQIRLLGKQVTVISSAVIANGETLDLYLDLSAYATELTDISSFRILARPLSGGAEPFSLRLYRATLESLILSGEELADLISADTENGALQPEIEEKRDYTTPILVTVLIVIASASLAAIVIFRHRRRNTAVSDRPHRTEATDKSNK